MKNILNKLLALWGILIAPIKAKIASYKVAKEKARLEKERLESIKELKADFEKRYNVNVKKSISVMGPSNQTDRDYQTAQLVEARKYMVENNIKPGGGQVTDIDAMIDHNTNGGYTNKTLNEVIIQDNDLAKKAIDGKLDVERKLKAKVRWVQRD